MRGLLARADGTGGLLEPNSPVVDAPCTVTGDKAVRGIGRRKGDADRKAVRVKGEVGEGATVVVRVLVAS